MASRQDHARQAKLEKRQELEKRGVMVHPYSYKQTHRVKAALELPSDGKTEVSVAGRITAIRPHGKVTFLTVKDETGEIQAVCRAEDLSDQYDLIKLLDPGDHIGITGTITTTKTGQLSVLCTTLTVLSKSLRPLPNSWQNIEDHDVRYRKRYLDMLINPEVRKILDSRFTIVKEIRRYLQDEHEFVEVETPILQPLYGGTNARPFTTHMNALDSQFYLRIAPELYLKRLIVGGYERIFEIARNFRNEGIDLTHQPEFTMIEWYESYADYQRVMDVAEGMFKHLAEKVNGTTVVQMQDHTIDLAGTWPRIRMVDALEKWANIKFTDLSDDQIQAELKKHKISLGTSFTRGGALFALFDDLVTPHLIQPTWIIDYPKEVSPLSKAHRSEPEMVERFEGYVGGKELCDGWSEITDALDQRSRFENEQRRMREGDEEAQPLDEEFLETMEYGMPPLGGIGIGIDRLVMFLTNTWAIREVIAFPTLRPLSKIEAEESEKSKSSNKDE